ncbi:hypothetical protein K503DRAFT_768992 [Rhizopogon vinicolor AM-OR11-026]|uniref:Transmembrane protein n=1 Tax=Rhizopogon vinicolor AM-OR11-026 TaxID=1314800 RepID=A0A1B7N595_9AGAM|nr:hypothetical protein K503DRAFT_768992 [Rhizopogon vinicolor AM-OR11-026]
MPSSLLPNFSAKPQQRDVVLSLHPIRTTHTSSAQLEQVQTCTGSLDHQSTSLSITKQQQESARQSVLTILSVFLHTLLVLLHLVLLVLSISGVEHRLVVLITSGNEIWETILSASSQAFYAFYCTILVYLMQRLTLLRNLTRRQTLTALHDTVNAWSGLGSALECLWLQTTITASWWWIVSITVYLTCVFTLHVVSSSIIQLQTFNATVDASATMLSHWPSPDTDMMEIQWQTISALIPTLDRFASPRNMGLDGATLYDVIQPNNISGSAVINATTLRADCGLVPNSILNFSPEINADNFGYYTLNPPISGSSRTMKLRDRLVAPFPDQVAINSVMSSFFPGPTVAFIVSTAVNSRKLAKTETVQHVYWEYPPISVISSHQPPLISQMYEVHVVACTIDVEHRVATVDVPSNQLLDLFPPLRPGVHKEWDAWSAPKYEPKWNVWSSSTSTIHHDKWLVYPFAHGAQHPIGWCMNQDEASCYGLSLLEIFFMQQIGIEIDFPEQGRGFTLGLARAPPLPWEVLCSRDQFESALSRAYAAVLWTAGQFGVNGGGFDRIVDTTTISQQLLQWHLGINLWPLAIALTCSLVMLVLSMRMTEGVHRHGTAMPIESAGVLQIMWLTSRLRVLSDLVSNVEDPKEDILRAAGMVEVDLLQELKLNDVRVDAC